MLTIVLLLSTYTALVAGSPVELDAPMHMQLSKPNSTSTVPAGEVDLDALQSQLRGLNMKRISAFEAYHTNLGIKHPLDTLKTLKNVTSQLPSVTTRSDTAGQGTVDLSNFWQGTLKVGSPPQGYTVAFDTASGETYLPGLDCVEWGCRGSEVYNPSESSTSEDLHKEFFLEYYDGSAITGNQYQDSVTIAGLTAKNTTIGAASSYTRGQGGQNPTYPPPDGLVGLGFKEISEFDADPLFQTLINQHQVASPVFGLKLSPSDSQLSLGGVNSALFMGGFTYSPVVDKGFWQINMQALSVDGTNILSNQQAVLDTSFTPLVGPTAAVSDIYGTVDQAKDLGNGLWSVPCDKMPSIDLTFGGKKFTIPPNMLNQGKIGETTECVAAIMGSEDDYWTIGDVFLQTVYTKFDVGGNRVGFATLK